MWIEYTAEHSEVRAQRSYQARLRDRSPAHHITVTGDEFRQTVQIDVDFKLSVLVYTGEGVVQQREGMMSTREARERSNVGDLVGRIGGTLEDHEPCGSRGQHALDARKIIDRKQ